MTNIVCPFNAPKSKLTVAFKLTAESFLAFMTVSTSGLDIVALDPVPL